MPKFALALSAITLEPGTILGGKGEEPPLLRSGLQSTGSAALEVIKPQDKGGTLLF